MDIIFIALNFVLQNETLRFVALIFLFAFLAGIGFCIWSSYIPARSLYKRPRSVNAKSVSLSELKESFRQEPDAWLFYMDELFYIPHADSLSEEERAALAKALTRLEDGGRCARQIGIRVFLSNSREARKYMHFIESRDSV